MPKPSDRVRDAMMGAGPIDPDIAPMCDREFYLAALTVIRKGDTAESRKAMLGRIPVAVRHHVENHIKRLWPRREEIRSNRYF